MRERRANPPRRPPPIRRGRAPSRPTPAEPLSFLLRIGWAALGWLLLASQDVEAQRDVDMLEAHDPLGTTATEGLGDSDASARAPRFAAVPPVRGEGLWAPPWVREEAASLRVRMGTMDAEGESRSVLRSEGRVDAEVRIVLRLPHAARLAGGEVCVASRRGRWRCRAMRPVPLVDLGVLPRGYEAALRAEPEEGEEAVRPVAWVTNGAGGHAVVWLAPLPAGGQARVSVHWRAPVDVLGGAVWLMLPARGDDVRLATERLQLETDREVAATIRVGSGGALELLPSEGAEVRARLRLSRPLRARFEGSWSGSRRCDEYATSWSVEGHVVASERSVASRRLLVVLDASRSMEGDARNRLPEVLAALMEALPSGSSVAWASLGAVARHLHTEWRLLEEAAFAEALSIWEGIPEASWTRPEALDAVLGRFEPPPTDVVVLSDGSASWTRTDLDALGRGWARRGVRLELVSLLEEEPSEDWVRLVRASGGRVLAPWPRWFADASSLRRADWLRGLWAEAVLRARVRWGCRGRAETERLTLWSGESVRLGLAGELSASGSRGGVGLDAPMPPLQRLPAPWGGRVRLRSVPFCSRTAIRLPRAPRSVCIGGHRFRVSWRRVAMGPWAALGEGLRTWAVTHGGRASSALLSWPRRLPGGVRRIGRPLARAVPRVSRGLLRRWVESGASVRSPPSVRRLPRATLLSMLRRRVIPPARRCLRRDRRGRADYAIRAVLRFGLARRELLFARVEGAVSESLARCLAATLERLDVPRFDGVALVRYPLRTRRVRGAPALELTEGVRAVLETAFEPVEDEQVWDLLSLPSRGDGGASR